jgi:pyruvate/2-oxoglutarate dehydrogenase complex dihydrolipoamide acyltransferase (E2) component
VVICVGAPSERCIVKDGKPAVATQLDLGIHFDHRLIDGAQIAAFLKSLRQHLYNIELIQDQIPLQSNEISIQTSHELH